MGINIDSLIAAASRKLGVPEEKIRSAVNSGNVAELRSYLGEDGNRRLDRVMNDGSAAEELRKKYMAGK
ncbi:MAG: hypothetical protein II820_08680 [Ruminiclostridium sp.]|nr:hypothetical protein [Ruminiclostridium sp.]